MALRTSRVHICPDCGGIMQPTEPEPLTCNEIEATDARATRTVSQCLLCGYTEPHAEEIATEAC
jgi:predicted nucleic-acid-binding Zn-ribbon protein